MRKMPFLRLVPALTVGSVLLPALARPTIKPEAASTTAMSRPPPPLQEGVQAPDFTVRDKDGKAIRLSDYRGKTVVLDFWATWCGVCMLPLHCASESAGEYARRGIVVLAVNTWDTPNALPRWLPDQKWASARPQDDGPIFAVDPSAGPHDRSRSVAERLYGVSGLPTQYVIGRDGRVVGNVVGFEFRDMKSGDKRLENLLKEAGA